MTNGPVSPDDTPSTSGPAAQVGRSIAAAALLIALGNILSRVLGLVREATIAQSFGVGALTSGFAIASLVPTQLYDLIVGGLVSAALIPVFSELAEHDDHELGRVAGTIMTLVVLLLAGTAGLVWLFAPQLGTLLTLGADIQQTELGLIRSTTISLIPWLLPATMFMALAGLTTGILQARQRFLLPAFSTATFNLGMIVGAITLGPRFGIYSLAIGMIWGGASQLLLQLPGLRGAKLRPSLNLRHPAVRRIGLLYVPVLIGLGFGLVGSIVDRALAAGVSDQAAAQMRYATSLVQLALGVVATAVSLAALPTLSRQAHNAPNLDAYRRTLALSIKAVLFVIFPITTLLAALAQPVSALVFGGGATTAADATAIASVLLVYLPMLIAAGIDQPLIFAFYARGNTLLPNLVNGAAIGAYLLTAFALVESLGVYGLIIANVVQWWTHALLMLWFAHRRLDALRNQRLAEALWKGATASIVAGVGCWLLYQTTSAPTADKGVLLLQIGALGSVGLLLYITTAALLQVETLSVFGAGVRRRLRRE